MKLLYILLISLLVSLCKVDNCTELETPINPSDCPSRNISKDNAKCYYGKAFLYFQWNLINQTVCVHITQEHYDTLPNRIRIEKAGYKLFGGINWIISIRLQFEIIYILLYYY
jgi:hypothetical protein